MQIAFTVKNTSKALKPNPDDILIYDGKIWYVTTKKDLFKEYDTRFEEKLRECNNVIYEMYQEREQMKAEINELKAEMARQMLEYGQIIRDFIGNKGE